MAKRKQTNKKQTTMETDLECIDIFYIPKPLAEMYRVLREAVAEDLMALWSKDFAQVLRVKDNEEEGEAVIALDDQGQECFRYYLNPHNISNAQEARDKEQFETYIDYYMKGKTK